MAVTYMHLYRGPTSGAPNGQGHSQIQRVHAEEYKAEKIVTKLRDGLLRHTITFHLASHSRI